MERISNEKLNTLSAEERFNFLSKLEKKYFNVMKAKAGVLYITSKPGLAKSSIAREIARIMGYNYFDIRLSTADETDFGMPKLKDIVINNIKYDVHCMTVPEWAIEANEKPTIIHFEELNRCSLNVRNACLGVLLERTIGTKFKFNDNVLMIASGNLGEDDGTDVEEFDSALNNRLVHMSHDLNFEAWIDQYAKYYVHPLIVSFIKNKPEFLYKKDGSDNGVQPRAYATPRTWTFLSEYILETLGDKEGQLNGNFDINAVKECVHEVGHGYIGTSISSFTKYLSESMNLTLDDILDRFQRVKPRLDEVNRDKKSELLNQLQEKDLKKLKPAQIKNLVSFLELIDEDERVGFLTYIIDKRVDDEIEEPFKTILMSFKGIMEQISNMT
ncbi:MAG: hypothetical protein RLZZ546_1946 [Bacteroidota bacterium]|jgi:MoxR-like ATPase